MVRAIHYRLMNWLKLLNMEVLWGNTNVMSQSGNKSGNILPKREIEKERWRCLVPTIESNAFSTMSQTAVSTSLAMVAQSWACSHHLHLPCSSDRFCSCSERWSCHHHLNRWPWSLASCLWHHCACVVPRGHGAYPTVVAASITGCIKKPSNIILPDCYTKTWISTPNFWAGTIWCKPFSLTLYNSLKTGCSQMKKVRLFSGNKWQDERT